MAGLLKPDRVEGSSVDMPKFKISYKPEKIESNVGNNLHAKFYVFKTDRQFESDMMKPLKIEQLMNQDLENLSSGEEKRVALCLCLGEPADIYLIDEPSASLDSEQRIIASKVIKRFILHAKKTAFVVEHDLMMANYLADKVIVFKGTSSVNCCANVPQSSSAGMDLFLSHMSVTVRRDPANHPLKFNKPDSTKDTQQKASGSYYQRS